MKQYLLYSLSGLSAIVPIFISLSREPLSILIPILALISSIYLILVASNISLFSQKIGAVVGLICLLNILCWSVYSLLYVYGSNWLDIKMIAILCLISYSVYYSIRFSLMNKKLTWNSSVEIKPLIKLLFILIQIFLLTLFVLLSWWNFISGIEGFY